MLRTAVPVGRAPVGCRYATRLLDAAQRTGRANAGVALPRAAVRVGRARTGCRHAARLLEPARPGTDQAVATRIERSHQRSTRPRDAGTAYRRAARTVALACVVPAVERRIAA